MTDLIFDAICSAELHESFIPVLAAFTDNIEKPDIVIDDINTVCISLQLLSSDHIISNGSALKESFSRSKKYKQLTKRVNIMPEDWTKSNRLEKITIFAESLTKAINLIPEKYISDENKLILTDAILSTKSHLILHGIPD